MKLTNRLNTVVDLITGKTVADIGCDHGKVPIKLILDGKCEKVIASDVNKGPAEACRKNVGKFGLSDRIEVRCGSGISVLEKGEVDSVVIAGMGGELIANIIDSESEIANSVNEFILQPMTSEEALRDYLQNNGFSINNESLALEGNKIYVIIRACKGNDTDNIYFPTKLKYNDTHLIDAYFSKVAKRLNDKINGFRLDNKKSEEEKYTKILNEVRGIYENIKNS